MTLYAEFLHLMHGFRCLGTWQKRAFALWCCGMVMAQSCQLSTVSDVLVGLGIGKSGAVMKRLSRFLSNPRISDEQLSQAWIRWVGERYGGSRWVVLVDETKLSNHLSVMMVGLAYQGRAVPLLWRCYAPGAYPVEGQSALIGELVTRLRFLVPDHIRLIIQADRGLGTSPDLIRQLSALPVHFLLRVQGQTRLRLANGQIHSLSQLVKPGESWCGRAEVFKRAGWLRLYVRIYWRLGEKSPWCLVTDSPWLRAQDYALRSWHEHSFRDLKSFGLRWDTSHVWCPRHAHRLLFVLALTYTWLLTQALAFTPDEVCSPSRSSPRQSLFRRGLRWVRQQLKLTWSHPVYPDFLFRPDTPLLC